MNRIFLNSLFVFLFLGTVSSFLTAQNSCPINSPTAYSVKVDENENCFLVVIWEVDNMPELTCGSPGTPAVGSGSFSGKLIDLEFDGTYVYQNGNNCNGTLFELIYHPTIPNAYKTTMSLCTVAAQSTTIFEANRTGSSNHTCTLTNNNPLPVELINFKGHLKEEGMWLEWATASEINNKHFVVERSTNGKDFEVLGVIDGAGNTVETKNYSFVDAKALAGDNYYRLKQVDFDGTFDYSEILVLHNYVEDQVVFYPTNVRDRGTLLFEAGNPGEIQVVLVNLNGKVLQNYTLQVEKGSNRFEFDFSDLPVGMYFMSALTNGGNQRQLSTTRVIKLAF